MNRFGIYYRDREFAREMGDPLLAVVFADSLDEALDLAEQSGISHYGAGLWAWPFPCEHQWTDLGHLAPVPWIWERCDRCGLLREAWGLDEPGSEEWKTVDPEEAASWLQIAESPLRLHLLYGVERPSKQP